MTTVNSDVIGPLNQHDEFEDWWESGPVKIPFWDQREMPLTFMRFFPENDPIYLAQADAALRHFFKFGAEDRLSLSDHVYKNCRDFLEAIGYDELDQPLWDIENPTEIWAFVHPQEVHVTRRDRGDRDIYVSLICACDWEREHGLQLVFRQGKQLTRISTEDGWLTHADAFGLPDEKDELLAAFRG